MENVKKLLDRADTALLLAKSDLFLSRSENEKDRQKTYAKMEKIQKLRDSLEKLMRDI